MWHRLFGSDSAAVSAAKETLACEQVELASVPFLTFIANKKATGEAAAYSFVLRGYVRTWINQITGEYDRLNLIDMLADRGVTSRAA